MDQDMASISDPNKANKVFTFSPYLVPLHENDSVRNQAVNKSPSVVNNIQAIFPSVNLITEPNLNFKFGYIGQEYQSKKIAEANKVFETVFSYTPTTPRIMNFSPAGTSSPVILSRMATNNSTYSDAYETIVYLSF